MPQTLKQFLSVQKGIKRNKQSEGTNKRVKAQSTLSTNVNLNFGICESPKIEKVRAATVSQVSRLALSPVRRIREIKKPSNRNNSIGRKETVSAELERREEKENVPKPKEAELRVQPEQIDERIMNMPEPSLPKVCASFETQPSISSKVPLFVSKQRISLPAHFQKLCSIFNALDYMCFTLNKRKQPAVFQKLKNSIQQMAKTNVEEFDLRKIRFVFDEAFTLKNVQISIEGRRVESFLIETNVDELTGKGSVAERKETFYGILLERVKECHAHFCNKEGVAVEGRELKNLHPKFSLESVPDIEINAVKQKEIPCQVEIPPTSKVAEETPALNTKALSLLERVIQFLPRFAKRKKRNC